MSNQSFVTVLVTVKKKTSTVPVECPEHEVPILRFIHGADAIEIVERDYGTIEAPGSAEAEFDRLTRKYDGKHDQVVKAVYTSLDQLASKLDLPVNYDPLAVETVQQVASHSEDHGREKAKAKAKEVAAEKKAKKAAKAPPDGKRAGAAS